MRKYEWLDFLEEYREISKLKHELDSEKKIQKIQKLKEVVVYYPSHADILIKQQT